MEFTVLISSQSKAERRGKTKTTPEPFSMIPNACNLRSGQHEVNAIIYDALANGRIGMGGGDGSISLFGLVRSRWFDVSDMKCCLD